MECSQEEKCSKDGSVSCFVTLGKVIRKLKVKTGPFVNDYEGKTVKETVETIAPYFIHLDAFFFTHTKDLQRS